MNVNDKRYVKVHRLIKQGFLELMETYPYREITLDRLCDHILIGKTTFYNHYQNKDALLAETEREAAEKLESYYMVVPIGTEYAETYDVIIESMEYVRRDWKIYHALFFRDAEVNFTSLLSHWINTAVLAKYEKDGRSPSRTAKTALAYGTNGFVYLLKRWVLGNISEEELVYLIRQIHTGVCVQIDRVASQKR